MLMSHVPQSQVLSLLVGADVVHIGTPRESSSEVKRWALLSMIQRQTVRTHRVWGRGAVAVRNQMLARRQRFPLMR